MIVSLAGKNILVAGATGAIGRAVAEAARRAGAWVVGSYLADEKVSRELQTEGIPMIQADLTRRSEARRLISEVLEEAGHLDALVYAAGNTRDRILSKLTEDDWDAVMGLHLEGLAASCQALLPAMQQRRQGKLVAFGSYAGLTGRAGQTSYSAAKAATIGFMKSLAREVGRFGITANVVCPGFIDSKMTRNAPAEAWERAKGASALGTVSSVEVVASFTTWLLSDLCFGVTGQVFQLDSRIL